VCRFVLQCHLYVWNMGTAQDFWYLATLGSPSDGPDDPNSLKARNIYMYNNIVNMMRYWNVYGASTFTQIGAQTN
jgi:hypothetical protein